MTPAAVKEEDDASASASSYYDSTEDVTDESHDNLQLKPAHQRNSTNTHSNNSNDQLTCNNNNNINNNINGNSDHCTRQTHHLVEQICQTHGIEAPRYTFARCLCGHYDRALEWSVSTHESVARLAEYLGRRAAIEAEYAQALQKLNRQSLPHAHHDERFSQLLVMGEKTAAGHADYARKIQNERVAEELRSLCAEHDGRRRGLQAELRGQREAWKRAVAAFERVRKARDRAQAAADASQLALQKGLATAASGQRRRLQADADEKNRRAAAARHEYQQAATALHAQKKEIFGERLPQLLESLERMERVRIGAVRTFLVSLAQGQLAFADVEVEGGERWLQSLVQQGVDEEIEAFIRSGPHGGDVEEDELQLTGGTESVIDMAAVSDADVDIDRSQHSPQSSQSQHSPQSSQSQQSSQSDQELESLLSDSWQGLTQQRDQLIATLTKLRTQLAGLSRMHESFTGQPESQAAVQQGLELVEREIGASEALLGAVERKLARTPRELELPLTNGPNPLSPIRSALQLLGELGTTKAAAAAAVAGGNSSKSSAATADNAQQQLLLKQKKKALSRSFEDVLASISISDGANASGTNASGTYSNTANTTNTPTTNQQDSPPIDTPPSSIAKLPGMQWSRSRSGSRVHDKDDDAPVRSQVRADGDQEAAIISSRRDFRTELRHSHSGDASVAEAARTGSNLGCTAKTLHAAAESIFNEREPPEPLTATSSISTAATLHNHEPVDLRPKWKELQKAKAAAAAVAVQHSTPPTAATTLTAIGNKANFLFKVQALYPFKGEHGNDELDLETGEVLGVLDADSEWWLAENELGIRGYIPFNYVIKLK